MVKLNASQLRANRGYKGNSDRTFKNNIYIILDNVLDTYNIGSIFRLADAIACKKVYLCGGTEIPPNHRIKKASISTTQWVSWEYAEDVIGLIGKMRKEIKNLQVVAIEQAEQSVVYNKFQYKFPICFIVGNESNGVSKEVLDLADGIVELPMYGVNISLNVMVSLGIIVYKALER